MTDENNAPKVDETPKIFGFPMDSFVKGGTSTWGHDKQVKQEWLEAEHRRDAQDAQKKVSSYSVDEGGAKMYSNMFADASERNLPKAYVLLKFVNHKLEPKYEHGMPLECLADILVPDNPAYDGELMLLMICPKCKERMPADHCIIQLRQSNRPWHLDERSKGELIVFDGQPYLSAGTVVDGEKFTCPRCDWKARIDRNMVREER